MLKTFVLDYTSLLILSKKIMKPHLFTAPLVMTVLLLYGCSRYHVSFGYSKNLDENNLTIENPDKSNSAISYYNRGNEMSRQGQYEDAILAYDAALKLKPDFSIALFSKGNVLKKLDRYEDAIDAYNAALRLEPDFLAALYNKGNTLDQLERYEAAIDAYDIALKLKPDSLSILNNKGVSLIDLGRYKEAIDLYSGILSTRRSDPNVYFVLSRCHALLNNNQLALDYLEKSIELSPSSIRQLVEASDDFNGLQNEPRFKSMMKHQ